MTVTEVAKADDRSTEPPSQSQIGDASRSETDGEKIRRLSEDEVKISKGQVVKFRAEDELDDELESELHRIVHSNGKDDGLRIQGERDLAANQLRERTNTIQNGPSRSEGDENRQAKYASIGLDKENARVPSAGVRRSSILQLIEDTQFDDDDDFDFDDEDDYGFGPPEGVLQRKKSVDQNSVLTLDDDTDVSESGENGGGRKAKALEREFQTTAMDSLYKMSEAGHYVREEEEEEGGVASFGQQVATRNEDSLVITGEVDSPNHKPHAQSMAHADTFADTNDYDSSNACTTSGTLGSLNNNTRHDEDKIYEENVLEPIGATVMIMEDDFLDDGTGEDDEDDEDLDTMDMEDTLGDEAYQIQDPLRQDVGDAEDAAEGYEPSMLETFEMVDQMETMDGEGLGIMSGSLGEKDDANREDEDDDRPVVIDTYDLSEEDKVWRSLTHQYASMNSQVSTVDGTNTIDTHHTLVSQDTTTLDTHHTLSSQGATNSTGPQTLRSVEEGDEIQGSRKRGNWEGNFALTGTLMMGKYDHLGSLPEMPGAAGLDGEGRGMIFPEDPPSDTSHILRHPHHLSEEINRIDEGDLILEDEFEI